LKARFFLIILGAILLTTTLVTWVHFEYLKSERLSHIDTQIRESAAVLVNSDLADLARIDFSAAEKIISEELGPNRLGKVFVIRNSKGNVIYASSNRSALNVDIPRDPQWVTLETNDFYIRVLNLTLPSVADRTLQVGLVLDANFMKWSAVSDRLVAYILIVVAIAAVISGFLAAVLLRPFTRLNRHLAKSTEDLKNLRDIQSLPPELMSFGLKVWTKGDEFSSLVFNIQSLIEKINQNYRMIRVWASRMAHELKTPLTILRSDLEVATRKGKLDIGDSSQLAEEIDSISAIVTEFLGWAELEQAETKGDIHAVRLRDVVYAAQQRFERVAPGRVKVISVDDTTAIAFPPHVEQMMNNLISNALKYSPVDKSVDILVSEGKLNITDQGEGIPAEVIERIGQPFNKGVNSYDQSRASTGLGLAIVSSIAKIYHWELSFVQSELRGTSAQVNLGDHSALIE